MTTPEGRIKAHVKAMLKNLGAWQFWPVSNGLGAHGIPDCVACFRGRFVSIETKAPGKKPTALQIMQGELIKKAGGVWVVIDSQEGAYQLEGELIMTTEPHRCPDCGMPVEEPIHEDPPTEETPKPVQ